MSKNLASRDGADDPALAGLVRGKAVARTSALILVLVGLGEIVVGLLSGSIALTADGADSVSDASISFVLWLGLRISLKSPDDRYQFGYFKFESFASMIAAIGMSVAGGVILYESYLRLLRPAPIQYAPLALSAVAVAASISLALAVYKRRISSRYSLLSLRTDANNSIKDVSASVIVFLTIVGVSVGVPRLDGVGGIIVAVYIFTVAYISLRSSSLVLLDEYHRTDVKAKVEKIVTQSRDVMGLRDVKLRQMGPFVTGRIHIVVDGDMSVEEMYVVVNEIKDSLRKQVPSIRNPVVTVEPAKQGTGLKRGR